MTHTPEAEAQRNEALWSDQMVTDLGLKAQARLLPYALGFFGIGLPIFLWTAAHALPFSVIAVYLGIFVANWVLLLWLKGRVDRQVQAEASQGAPARQITDRLWRQGLGGGVWAVSLLCISVATAAMGGPHAEYVLIVCAGAAASLIFFYAPVLLFLLILGPVAIVGPVIGLRMLSLDWDAATIINGGLFLAWAMGFVLNRHLREHYHLEHRRTVLAQEREAALETARHEADARSALMEILSREVQSGLRAVTSDLAKGVEHLDRAPVPRQHVNAALKTVRQLKSLLVTTLDNDTAASGRLSVHREAVDLEQLCADSAAEAADAVRSRGLTFTFSSALPAAGRAMGDAHRIGQILEQLLANAVAYTPSGKVEMRILPPGEGFVRVEVLDSGPGLSAEELTLAFKPHTRITRTGAGTSGAGLGLSLCVSLARLMGARVGGESTLDVGSKFWLDLPWDADAQSPAQGSVSVSKPQAASVIREESLRVLLVAENSLRLAQLRDMLEALGHQCLTSATPERALRLALKAQIDACLLTSSAFSEAQTDMTHFAGDLRAVQNRSDLPVLAILDEGQGAESLGKSGLTPLLSPLSREALRRALDGVDHNLE